MTQKLMQEKCLRKSIPDKSISRWNRLKVTQGTIQIVIGLLLLWWIFDRLGLNGERLLGVFSRASPSQLGFAVLCFATSMGLKALQLLNFSNTVSAFYMIGVSLTQNALLTFLPLRVGELSVPILLRQDQKIPVVNSLSAILAIRILDLLVVVSVALVGSQRLGLEFNPSSAIVALGIAALLLVAIDLAVRWLRGETLWKIVVLYIRPLHDPVRVTMSVLLSTAIFILSTLQSMFAFGGFGLDISFFDIALLNSLTLLAAMLPIHPPGGWGTIDSIQIAILHRLNYRAETFGPVILAVHCFYTVLILFGGLVGWVMRKRCLS